MSESLGSTFEYLITFCWEYGDEPMDRMGYHRVPDKLHGFWMKSYMQDEETAYIIAHDIMKKNSSVSNLHQTIGSRKPHRVIMVCGSQESSGFCPSLPQMCESRYKQMWVPDDLSFFGKQFVKRQALDDQLLSAAWSTGLGMCVDSGAISFCPYERTPIDLQKWFLKLLSVNFSCSMS